MKLKILLSLSFAALLFSCRKDKDNSMRAYLHGSWQLTELAIDQNQNQIIDSGESIQLPSELIQVVFKGDGTGNGNLNYTNYHLGVDFTWTTDESENLIYIHAGKNSLSGQVVIEDNRRFRLMNVSSEAWGNNGWGLIQVFERR